MAGSYQLLSLLKPSLGYSCMTDFNLENLNDAHARLCLLHPRLTYDCILPSLRVPASTPPAITGTEHRI